MNPMNKIGQIYIRTNIKVFGAFFSAPIDAHCIRRTSRPISYVFFLYTYIELLLLCSLVYDLSQKNTTKTKDQRKAATTSIISIALIINWWRRVLLLIVWASLSACVFFLIKNLIRLLCMVIWTFFPLTLQKALPSVRVNAIKANFVTSWIGRCYFGK